MYLLRVAFLIFIFCVCGCIADSFVYPVAKLNDEKLFVIYQKSITQLELWIWDLQQKACAFKGLPSHIIPAGLKILPSGKGFSFIDQGRIKIKYFGRRSPKAIDINEPIYDISLIEWISDNACYLSARHSTNCYGIYHLYTSGAVISLVCNSEADNMYPQKQNSTLFYIERKIESDMRNKYYHYRIMQTAYPALPVQEIVDFDTRLLQGPAYREVTTASSRSLVIDNYKNPLIFLRMSSETEGYVIEHQATVNEDDECIECVYHHIYYADTIWHMVPLFCFSLPIDILFTSTTRLYESIIPLLPYHSGSKIYYVDSTRVQNQLNLNVFVYDTYTNRQTQLTHAQDKQAHYFGLCAQGNTIFYGGSLETCLCDPPDCTPSSEGFITFNLGRIT